ncbi:MAG: PepSY domain-containing protein [Burkholderiales bacterium]|nr:PepSY domain-containing protein [Burkholderiales bacterium]
MKRTLMPLVLVTALTGSLGAVSGCAIAAKDRPPTDEERARIVKVLQDNGYTSFGEIEVEGNKIEVEDAVHTDGKTYELKLDAKTLKILKKKEES